MQAGGKRRGRALENHEPSSPKVTCIGQVRVKKTMKHVSKLKTLSTRRSDGGEDRNRQTSSSSSCVAVFERWWFVRIEGGKGKREIERDKKPEIMEEGRVSICIPPKNALLMMRYRSDPVKMAALSSRLFQTPVHLPKADEEEEDDGGASVQANNAQVDGEGRKNHDLSLLFSVEEKQPSSSSSSSSSSSPPLPDCLLLMICEPKLSMEVSKETWVCSTDFDRRLPEQKKRVVGNNIIIIPQAPAPPLLNGSSVVQPSRSSCSLPAAVAMIEQKLAYPFVLTRCKSVPMKTPFS